MRSANYNLDMSDNQKKPGAAFWAGVILLLALAYPASFGPACWLVGWGVLPVRATAKVYRPFVLEAFGDDWLANSLFWYAGICDRNDSGIHSMFAVLSYRIRPDQEVSPVQFR